MRKCSHKDHINLSWPFLESQLYLKFLVRTRDGFCYPGFVTFQPNVSTAMIPFLLNHPFVPCLSLSEPFYGRNVRVNTARVWLRLVWQTKQLDQALAFNLTTSSSPSSWYCSSTLSSCWSGFPAICWNKRGGSCYCTLEMPFIVLGDKEWACHHEQCTPNALVARKWWTIIANTKHGVPVTLWVRACRFP